MRPCMRREEPSFKLNASIYWVATMRPGDSSTCGDVASTGGRTCRLRRSSALLFVDSTERIDRSAMWHTCNVERAQSAKLRYARMHAKARCLYARISQTKRRNIPCYNLRAQVASWTAQSCCEWHRRHISVCNGWGENVSIIFHHKSQTRQRVRTACSRGQRRSAA